MYANKIIAYRSTLQFQSGEVKIDKDEEIFDKVFLMTRNKFNNDLVNKFSNNNDKYSPSKIRKPSFRTAVTASTKMRSKKILNNKHDENYVYTVINIIINSIL